VDGVRPEQELCLRSARLIIATGSDARVPEIEGLAEVGYWTNREATTLSEIPDSIVILGGGPVGVELGQFLARFGTQVTIVQGADRLLPREDPAVGALVLDVLRENGIDVRLGAHAVRVTRDGPERVVHLEGGETVSGCELLVATGRAPRVADLGLETLGVEVDPAGLVVDERCRVTDGVWAVGDVTGVAVGLTELQAREQGLDVSTAHVKLAEAIARPWTYQEDPGELGLIADRARGVLVGAWAVAPLAGEWIHYAALAVKTETPLAVLRDTVAQFPTFTEAYLKGFEQL